MIHANDQFCGAAADIHHQLTLTTAWGAMGDAQVDKASLLPARNDLYGKPRAASAARKKVPPSRMRRSVLVPTMRTFSRGRPRRR